MIHIKNCINLKELEICDSFMVSFDNGKSEEILELLVADKTKEQICLIPRYFLEELSPVADRVLINDELPSYKCSYMKLKILPKYEKIFTTIFKDYEITRFDLLDVNDLYSDRKLAIFKQDKKYIASDILHEFQYGDLQTCNYWVKNSSINCGYSFVHYDGRVVTDKLSTMICGIRPLIKIRLK